MALFGIRSSRNSRKHRGERRQHDRVSDNVPQAQQVTESGVFSIDIGTPKPFKVRMHDVSKFIFLSDGSSKVCIRAQYEDTRDDEVVCLKWSQAKSEVNPPDVMASQIASSAVATPRYRYRSLFNHQGIYVCLSIRNYIPGKTLEHAMASMTYNQVSSIEMQVSAVVWSLARKVSPYFGHLKSSRLRTSTAGAYVRSLAFADTITGSMDATCWQEVGNDSYVGTSVFCHGSLTPDHIIVEGTSLVGIVGWSSADFMPEAYDRLRHYFMSEHGDPCCWNRRMCNITTSASTKPPSVEFAMNATSYAYRSAWCKATSVKRDELNRLWVDVRTNYKIIPSISSAVEVECDNMSLSSLTSWTDTSQVTYVGIID